ncbi:MAG: hypothetical protein ABSE77_00120 [Acidimicrobiales bacterium]|jgi:hypothetical protein
MSSSPWRRTSAAVATLAIAGAVTSGLAQAQPARAPMATPATTMGTKAKPAVEDCGLGKPEVRPASLILACADANDQAVKLVWTKWTAAGAYARGTDTWNTCVPYCAASKTWDKTAANFTLSDPVKTPAGWLFEKLVVHITGKAPKDMERTVVYSEKPFPK